MKYYRFGNKINFKFLVRNDLSKKTILCFYTPTTLLSKIYFNLSLYKFNIISNEEQLKYRLNEDNISFMLKCNDPQNQKFISYYKDQFFKIKKWAFSSSTAKFKIQNEIKNINYLKGLSISKLIEIPTILNQSTDIKNPIVFFEMKKGTFLRDSSVKKLNLEFLSFFFREFSLKFSFIKENKILTLSHGDLTAWNVKIKKNGYYILDWEEFSENLLFHDLIHYQFTFFHILMGLSIEKSFKKIKYFDFVEGNAIFEKNFNEAFNNYKKWKIEKK